MKDLVSDYCCVSVLQVATYPTKSSCKAGGKLLTNQPIPTVRSLDESLHGGLRVGTQWCFLGQAFVVL